MPKPTLPLTALVVACAAATASARAGEAKVAVAANFAAPLSRLAEGFGAATGHTLKVSSGATGKLYAQIAAGAPFEVLLAADDETPKKLIEQGLAVAGSSFTYALGTLVLWSAQPGLVDDRGAVLEHGRFAHLAIANPKLAPYGRAALQVLQARGLAERLAPRLVSGESIAQAYQFVATGNAELGFVALAQIMVAAPMPAAARPPAETPPTARVGESPAASGPASGSYWQVPRSLYGEIRQDAVLLTAGAQNPAAAALLAYLKSAPAQALIRSFGYGP
jgi:molybdate transport system substrate-binding protein